MELQRLTQPFPPKDVEWRVQVTGKNGNGAWAMLLPYVTNRAIMNRLDEVVGPENWKNEFRPGATGGMMCGLSIRIPVCRPGRNDEWVTKWDGAQETAVEPIKGGFSDAMKRAAVQWGIGRYLYYLDFQVMPVLPACQRQSGRKDRPKQRYIRVDDRQKGISGYCEVPRLPDWALPKEGGGGETQEPEAPEENLGPKLQGITYRRKGNLIIAEGNTFAVKGSLKNAGFRWNANEKAWAKPAPCPSGRRGPSGGEVVNA